MGNHELVSLVSDLANELKDAQWKLTDFEALQIAVQLINYDVFSDIGGDIEQTLSSIECQLEKINTSIKER